MTILERGRFGRGASHGNCGYVSPSHALPLTEPGAVGKALRAIVSRNSPFKIRPRLDWGLWSWLLKFAARCNERDMLAAGRARVPLLLRSAELFRELVREERLECQWQDQGLLMIYNSQAGHEKFAHVDELLAREFNLGARRLDGPELTEFEPALLPGPAGAWWYEIDAHLRPDVLMRSFAARLREMGVEIHEEAEVLELPRSEGGTAAARTAKGDFPAEVFVLAGGALTPRLAAKLGVRLPIQPGKGYSITMSRPAVCPKVPMIFMEQKVAVTPFEDGYRLGSTMEFAGYNDSVNPARLGLLRAAAEKFLRDPFGVETQEQWCGWRPMTCDDVPIIGRAPGSTNTWIASGHGMLGLSMGPGTGKLIAQLITGAAPEIDPKPYEPARFA